MNKVLRHAFAPVAGVVAYIFSYMILLSLFLLFVRVNDIKNYTAESVHTALDILFGTIATFAQWYIIKKIAPKNYIIHIIISYVIFIILLAIGALSFYIEPTTRRTGDWFHVMDDSVFLVGLVSAIIYMIVTIVKDKKQNNNKDNTSSMPPTDVDEQALRKERKREIARIILERAIERAKNADPITEPKGAQTMIRPQRMKDETAYEYAMRLKEFYSSIENQQLKKAK